MLRFLRRSKKKKFTPERLDSAIQRENAEESGNGAGLPTVRLTKVRNSLVDSEDVAIAVAVAVSDSGAEAPPPKTDVKPLEEEHDGSEERVNLGGTAANGDRSESTATAAVVATAAESQETRRKNSHSATKKHYGKTFNFSETLAKRDDPDSVGDGNRSATLPATSQNEHSEWLGHVFASFGKRRKSKKKPQDDQIPSTTKSKSKQSSPLSEDADSARIGSDHAQQSTVKYRKLGNNPVDEEKEHFKRHSRLSLPFGLHLRGRDSQPVRRTIEVTEEPEPSRKKVDTGKWQIGPSARKILQRREREEERARYLHELREQQLLESLFNGNYCRGSPDRDQNKGGDKMARGRNNSSRQRNQQQQPPETLSGHHHSQNGGSSVGGNSSSGNAALSKQSIHLETISDPASTSTNKFQMTRSKNSSENFNQSKANAETQHRVLRRSNSAECLRTPPPENRVPTIAEVPLNAAIDTKADRIHAGNTTTNGAVTVPAELVPPPPPPSPQQQQQQQTNQPIVARNLCPAIAGDVADAFRERESNELAECDRVDLVTCVDQCQSAATPDANEPQSQFEAACEDEDDDDEYEVSPYCGPMGQTNAKSTDTQSNRRASTPREFRESAVPETDLNVASPANGNGGPKVIVPEIRVIDYSLSDTDSPVQQEVFFDFENAPAKANHNEGPKITAIEEEVDIEDEVFHDDVPSTSTAAAQQQRNWSPQSQKYTFLEDVQEEDEEEELNHETVIDIEQTLRSIHFDSPDSGIAEPRNQLPRHPFLRDSVSLEPGHSSGRNLSCTDTESDFTEDEMFMPNDRSLFIESITLPDVVESSNVSNSSVNCADIGGEQILNINGASGNSLGNVHFIPIHVEGEKSGSPKRQSVDDSVLGKSGRRSPFSRMSGSPARTSIEIIEDVTELHGRKEDAEAAALTEKLRRELAEQESKFKERFAHSEQNIQSLLNQIESLQTTIKQLEQDLSQKLWTVDKLQAELTAAQREDEFVRQRMKFLDEEKTELRHKTHDNEELYKRAIADVEAQLADMESKYEDTESLARGLKAQLTRAQMEADSCRAEVSRIREELGEQVRILQNELENKEAELKICGDKWQRDFETMRTQNMQREEMLIADCEWQVRLTQKQCKEKVEKSDFERKEAIDSADKLKIALEELEDMVESLKIYQCEVVSLRGVISEQDTSLQSLNTQIERLKEELEEANNTLEDQIEAVRKIKFQCDNELCDKDRQMTYRIDEVRNELSAFWENKLYTELTRLTNELESVYAEERTESLNKLRDEHVEELRVLTSSFSANEEELRTEIIELQERYDIKSKEFLELREKSDNALLQTRMHLDRADRDFQTAMCREEERREELEVTLRKEFETEKAEMEEKFRERLGHVKEEFAKELQISMQEMTGQHKKELAMQKAKLQAEKDEAMHELADRHRKRLAAAEEKIKEVELRQQRDLQDLKATYDTEKAIMDKRDISNTNDIEQLHRRCRCLTNLFEEMRMRYERRDPRPEDLNEISELRTRCESQDRDLSSLTDRLREMQILLNNVQQHQGSTGSPGSPGKKAHKAKKPPPKVIPTNCEVILEENEESESHHANATTKSAPKSGEESFNGDSTEDDNTVFPTTIIELNGKGKVCGEDDDTVNDDDSHMVTAM